MNENIFSMIGRRTSCKNCRAVIIARNEDDFFCSPACEKEYKKKCINKKCDKCKKDYLGLETSKYCYHCSYEINLRSKIKRKKNHNYEISWGLDCCPWTREDFLKRWEGLAFYPYFDLPRQ